jgi:hypothetical protein
VTAAQAFAGFLPQITEHLGPVQWVEEPTAHGPNRGFAVLYLNAPGSEVGSAVTNGLRFQTIKAVFPQELCCSPFADAEFDTVRDTNGTPEMQIITLIPAAPAELALAAEQGRDALFVIWEQQETDLADINRPSAV